MSTLMLLSQVGFGGFTVAHWAIIIIIIAAVIAVMYVGLNKMGVAIPDWVIKIFWILVVAIVCIIAIKILIGLA
jgi:hypothetical protein